MSPPSPHKRPKCSLIRFEASLPNESWQSDVTFYELCDGTKVEIVNFIDDFSRVCGASKVLATTTSPDVVATPLRRRRLMGPAGLASERQRLHLHRHLRGGYSAMESELFHLGIASRHSRPYHPQT